MKFYRKIWWEHVWITSTTKSNTCLWPWDINIEFTVCHFGLKSGLLTLPFLGTTLLIGVASCTTASAVQLIICDKRKFSQSSWRQTQKTDTGFHSCCFLNLNNNFSCPGNRPFRGLGWIEMTFDWSTAHRYVMEAWDYTHQAVQTNDSGSVEALYTFQAFVQLLLGFCFKPATVIDCLPVCNQCEIQLWSTIQLSFIPDKLRQCHNVNQSRESEKIQEIYLKTALWTQKKIQPSHLMQTSFLLLHKDI